MNGRCRESNIIYKANISTVNSNGGVSQNKNYIGLTSTQFIDRYRNHSHSFSNNKLRNATELSKYVWSLKDKGSEYQIEWEIVKRARVYKPGDKYCNLCTAEAIAIAINTDGNCLNSKNEVIKKCRHRSKWKLNKFGEF